MLLLVPPIVAWETDELAVFITTWSRRSGMPIFFSKGKKPTRRDAWASGPCSSFPSTTVLSMGYRGCLHVASRHSEDVGASSAEELVVTKALRDGGCLLDTAIVP